MVGEEEAVGRLTHLVQFFKELYQSQGPRNFTPVIDQLPEMVTTDMNRRLLAEVTIEEVTDAAFQLGATKAPGPDGLNGLFYHHHWEDIKWDIFKEVKKFSILILFHQP